MTRYSQIFNLCKIRVFRTRVYLEFKREFIETAEYYFHSLLFYLKYLNETMFSLDNSL